MKLKYDGFDRYPCNIEIHGKKDDKKYKIVIPISEFKHILPLKLQDEFEKEYLK